MFRFLHSADLHLDSPMLGLAKREGAPVDEILGASRRAFESLIDLALAESVDFVLIAGDVYDRDWKGYETGLFFRRGMVRLQGAGIPVFLISGNHDAASVVSRKLSLPDNVHVFSSRAPETIRLARPPVAVHGMSFPNREVRENLVPRYPAPVQAVFNIGLLHTSVGGSVGHDTYAPSDLNELSAKGYDYWALGHIHQPAVLAQDPWIVYPGNTQGRSVKECGPRGCRLVDVDDSGSVSDCRAINLDQVRWERLVIEANPCANRDELRDRIARALSSAMEAAEDRLLAARLEITGATPLHGWLGSHAEHFETELAALAEEVGGQRVWIEKVRIRTNPVETLEALAKRDPLTRVVLEVVGKEQADHEIIEDVADLEKALPHPLNTRLAELIAEEKKEILDDASALILERLKTRGGEA